jgi:voltage-gated potassium channel
VRLLLGVLGMLIIFYAVPVSTRDSTARVALSVLLTLLGVGALGWAIVGQLKRQLHSRSEDIHTLLMLLPLAAMVFALGFYVLEEHSPSQLNGLSTRTDALYFTLSTLTTVGYGDITAEGQIARALVILQLVFNAVFVGAAVSTVVATIRNRAPISEEDGNHDSG